MVLIDTNILFHSVNADSPEHKESLDCLDPRLKAEIVIAGGNPALDTNY